MATARTSTKEQTVYDLSPAAQPAEVRKWAAAVAAKRKEIAAAEKRGALTSTPGGFEMTLVSLYRDLAYQLEELSNAKAGVAIDRAAQRRNARKSGWD